jgi:hypothetical protein
MLILHDRAGAREGFHCHDRDVYDSPRVHGHVRARDGRGHDAHAHEHRLSVVFHNHFYGHAFLYFLTSLDTA